MFGDRRGVSEVMGTVLLVALAVVMASVVSAVTFDLQVRPPAPTVVLSHDIVGGGSERFIAVTLELGDAVETERLYVVASVPVDIGGPPGSSIAPREEWASDLEKFTEASGANPPQVGIGDTWDAGETVYLNPVGSVDGVEVRIYWNTRSVVGVNPGTVTGEYGHLLATFTV